MLSRVRRLVIGIVLLAASGAAPITAQILNSERIEQTFGSYGIDVIASAGLLRVSNLYSLHDCGKITRTLAVVEYPEIVNPAFAAEHQAILDGGSIGSTFQAAGWAVVKRNLSIIEVAAADRFAALMGVDHGTQLATHLYRLDVVRDERQLSYALIAETHHPEYLSKGDLTNIYPLELEALAGDSFGLIPPPEESLRHHTRLLNAGLEMLRDPG